LGFISKSYFVSFLILQCGTHAAACNLIFPTLKFGYSFLAVDVGTLLKLQELNTIYE